MTSAQWNGWRKGHDAGAGASAGTLQRGCNRGVVLDGRQCCVPWALAAQASRYGNERGGREDMELLRVEQRLRTKITQFLSLTDMTHPTSLRIRHALYLDFKSIFAIKLSLEFSFGHWTKNLEIFDHSTIETTQLAIWLVYRLFSLALATHGSRPTSARPPFLLSHIFSLLFLLSCLLSVHIAPPPPHLATSSRFFILATLGILPLPPLAPLHASTRDTTTVVSMAKTAMPHNAT
jgi:hypothetical protein